jgi:serine/threonine-protein kinase RsbW
VAPTSNTKDELSSALGLSDGESADVDPSVESLTESDEAQSKASRKEFEFPGDLASVAESREQVMQFVGQHCSDEGDRIDILVALQEALANAALHGCGDDAAKKIECAVEAGSSEIVITVCDPGPGFDLALADPTNFTATTRSNGRGICLMRSLMTEVAFAHGGSEIQLRKHLETRGDSLLPQKL